MRGNGGERVAAKSWGLRWTPQRGGPKKKDPKEEGQHLELPPVAEEGRVAGTHGGRVAGLGVGTG